MQKNNFANFGAKKNTTTVIMAVDIPDYRRLFKINKKAMVIGLKLRRVIFDKIRRK